ncbi:MAG: Holliday junction resolvase RuvX [Bacteroidales bacterium]|nr:Holliday junction resolvase RuvX [Bacteroidales bacterium]
MSRILSIDYGRKRVGLAVSDPMGMIATGLETIPTGEVWQFLKTYLDKEDVETIVVGYPLQMNNQPSESLKYIDPFMVKLKKEYSEMEILMVDERFTSKMARQAMLDGGVKKKDRRNKALVDKLSAVIILQTHLDSVSRKL